jgi:murein L,D-transpeptidase YcbB/YkuD
MSNAQQIEQHQAGQQQDAAAQTTQGSEPSLELRPDLKAQLLQMDPADAGPLAEMLKLYPNLSGGIILFAASHLGNAFVQRAIAIAKGGKAQGRPGAMSRDEVRASIEGPAAPLSAGEMRGFLEDGPAAAQPKKGPLSHQEMHEFLDDSPARAQPAEPAWVADARAYNAAHSELVEEFNELTDNVARLDGESKVDPQAVARWQGHHGVAADGKIGPRTVAAARALKAKAPAVAAAPQADARPPV